MKGRDNIMNAKVFEQVNTELVRMKSTEEVRLFAIYFDDKSGNLAEIYLEAGIHALAKRCGAVVTVESIAGVAAYQFCVGDVFYTQRIPKQNDNDTAADSETV